MNICVYGAASKEIDAVYIKAGEELGRMIAKQNHSLVFGGGANGLMGAVARGVSENNGKITSIAPSFFNVDGVLFNRCDEYIYTETMRERKQLMEDKSDAFIVTPGGIGTFEEFFEILTLKSLDRHAKPIAIYNTNGYYDEMMKFLQNAVNQSFMKKDNLSLFTVSDSANKILSYLEDCSNNHADISKTRYI